MPEYHCGVEVQAALDAGFDVQYYKLHRDLSIDEEDLEQRLETSPGPVFAIHYFGFAQPGVRRIADRCRELGVPLIEDCAHALFSATGAAPLGSIGPISIFSFRKSLPLYDGGGLRVVDFPFTLPDRPGASPQTYVDALKQLAKGVLGARGKAALGRLRKAGDESAPGVPAWEQQDPWYSRGFSTLSRRIAASCDPAAIVRARRSNWQQVHARLAGIDACRPVWDRLDEGTCPLFHCVWVRDRDVLMQRLAARGVETFRFGARPHPTLNLVQYVDSHIYRERILALPIHQDLSRQALDWAVDNFVAEVNAHSPLDR